MVAAGERRGRVGRVGAAVGFGREAHVIRVVFNSELIGTKEIGAVRVLGYESKKRSRCRRIIKKGGGE